jgi:hypothetical protein
VKLCRAAALALMGWYLLSPPIRLGTLATGRTGYKLASSLPLTEWSNFGGFDSAQQCEVRRLMDIEAAKNQAATRHFALSNFVDQFNSLELTATVLAQWVATNDPRFAK